MLRGRHTGAAMASEPLRRLQRPPVKTLVVPFADGEMQNRTQVDMPFAYQRPNARKAPKIHGVRTRDGRAHLENAGGYKPRQDGPNLQDVHQKSRKRPDRPNFAKVDPGNLYRKPPIPERLEPVPITISSMKLWPRSCQKSTNQLPEIRQPCPGTKKVRPVKNRTQKTSFLKVTVPF